MDQVVSKVRLKEIMSKAVDVSKPAASDVDNGVEPGSYVTKSGSGCVLYPGVTQQPYKSAPVKSKPSSIFG